MNIKGYWIGVLVFSLAGNVGARAYTVSVAEHDRVKEKVAVHERDIEYFEERVDDNKDEIQELVSLLGSCVDSNKLCEERYSHCSKIFIACKDRERNQDESAPPY